MEFEWDRRKAAVNRRKHGVDFADAATVLYDKQALTIEDDHPEETRFVTLG
ncbi:MAG: BrnT family toxin, partial [Nitrosopumilus sp.]